MKNIFAFIFLFGFCPISSAEYIATGGFKGDVCHGFGIRFCSNHDLAAVKGKNKQIYSINRAYEKVSSYRNGNCLIEVKSHEDSPVAWVVNAFNEWVFMEKNDKGELVEVDIENLIFPCKKI